MQVLCLRFEDFLKYLGTLTVIEGEETEWSTVFQWLILTGVKRGPKEVRIQNEVAVTDWFSHQNYHSEIQIFKFRQVRWCIAWKGPQIKQRRQLMMEMKHKIFHIIIELFI